MMGSRGEPSPQVTALVTLCELLELAKSADLPAHIAQLREAEKAERTAFGELDKKSVELDARQTALDERTDALELRELQTTARERACDAQEQVTARQQATFDEQKAALAAQSGELADGANLLTAERAAFDGAKLRHAGDLEAKAAEINEEINRLRRENEAAIQVMRNKAATGVAEMYAKAQAQLTAAQETLQAREDKLAAREEELHRERARISALLQE